MTLTAIPKISQLSSRVIRILGMNPGPMTLQGTNTYLIGSGHHRILLDSGEKNNKQYLTLLEEVLKKENVTLNRIIITHWHQDHVGGVSDILSHLKPQGCRVQKMKYHKQDDPAIDFDDLDLNEEVRVEGATFRLYHTPGHTEDHVIAVLKEENALFSGDCILGDNTTTVFEDLKTYMESLDVILSLKPDVIYPGHGSEIRENPSAKIMDYISHRQEREKQIVNSLPSTEGEALSLLDIVKQVYQDVPEYLHGAAAVNVDQHLAKLMKEGEIGCVEVRGTTRYFRHLKR